MADARIAVPDELFETSGGSYYSGELEIDLLDTGVDQYVPTTPISWSVSISNTGENLVVLGHASMSGTTSCARCLEEVEYELDGEIEGYVFLDEPTPEQTEGFDVDEYVVLDDDKVIDLEPMIRAALCLDAPLIPLCDDDCKGLCPECGANLNEGPCSCEKKDEQEEDEFHKNPFAVLKGLKFDD